MEGFWVETSRGLETLNPRYLQEFLVQFVPQLKSRLGQEISIACFQVLWNKGPRLIPWTTEDLTRELAEVLTLLGQTPLARVLLGQEVNLSFLEGDEATSAGLSDLEGAVSHGFLELGQLFRGWFHRQWDGSVSGLSSELVLLDAPDPSQGSKVVREWLNGLKARKVEPGQTTWIVCDWNLDPHASLFSRMNWEAQKKWGGRILRAARTFLKTQGGPGAALFWPRNQPPWNSPFSRFLFSLPEGIRLGLLPPASGPGKVLAPLFARGEVHLEILSRVRGSWEQPFREWVSILHRVRRYWSRQLPQESRDKVPKSIRWVIKGWNQGPGRPEALSILAALSRMVPAEDDVVLGWEKEVPNQPGPFSRWADHPALLERLEECRMQLSTQEWEETGPLWHSGFQGIIWVETIKSRGKKRKGQGARTTEKEPPTPDSSRPAQD